MRYSYGRAGLRYRRFIGSHFVVRLLERGDRVTVRGNDVALIPTAETNLLYPTSVYAVTKRDYEELCHVVGSAYGVPTVALRLFNVSGSGQALSKSQTASDLVRDATAELASRGLAR